MIVSVLLNCIGKVLIVELIGMVTSGGLQGAFVTITIRSSEVVPLVT